MSDKPSCGAIERERMRYFTGRFMTARDFRDEQWYFLTHRNLHNRILHGWGVACGLHVHPHRSPQCNTSHVRVDCGLAIDCCGRDVVVETAAVPPEIPWKERPSEEPAEQAQQPQAAQSPAQQQQHGTHDELERDHARYPLLCVCYRETEVEAVPVLYTEHNCDAQRREFSRILEGYEFVWKWARYSELPQYYWKVRDRGCPEHGHDDCEQREGDHEAACCLSPRCPPEHCVPLAWIRVQPGHAIERKHIHMIGRPSIEAPVHSLTHVCSINWPHGGVVSRQFVEHNLSRLEIRFDRRLKAAEHRDGGPYGVNSCTFVVQFGGESEDLDFVPAAAAPTVEHDNTAVYRLDPREHEKHGRKFAYLENQTVFITLKCDFILDCHGVPVDGDHLGGVLPSGNGIRGGTFESWFQVVPDHEWDRRQRQMQQNREVSA